VPVLLRRRRRPLPPRQFPCPFRIVCPNDAQSSQGLRRSFLLLPFSWVYRVPLPLWVPGHEKPLLRLPPLSDRGPQAPVCSSPLNRKRPRSSPSLFGYPSVVHPYPSVVFLDSRFSKKKPHLPPLAFSPFQLCNLTDPRRPASCGLARAFFLSFGGTGVPFPPQLSGRQAPTDDCKIFTDSLKNLSRSPFQRFLLLHFLSP